MTVVEPTGKHGGARPNSGPKTDGEQRKAYTALVKAKAKREEYNAELARLAYEEKLGQLIPSDEVEAAWASHIAAAKTALLALPSKLAYELASVSDPAKISELLRMKISEALSELAGSDGKLG